MFKTRFSELENSLDNAVYTTKESIISENKAIELTHSKLEETRKNKGIVYFIGNGGSAGIASHFSNDLMKALRIPSLTFYDSNLLTCLSNDIGYENVFSYPLELVLKSNDLLVAISSSGKSPNILKAAKTAIEQKATLLTFSGFSDTNPLRQMGDINFWVGVKDYGLVETAHFFQLHTIVDLWNKTSKVVEKHVISL